MLQKLFSWLFGSDINLDIYKPSERQIYRYDTGQKIVHVDPLPLYKKVMANGPALWQDIKISMSAHKDAPKKHDSLVKLIREIFSLKPFEEGGLTEVEVMELLDHFLLFCSTLKKNWSQSVTLPAESGGEPSAPASQPTESSSDSGSIGGDISTSKPEQLPMA